MVMQVKGQSRCHKAGTHLWARGSSKPVNALRTKERRVRVRFSRTTVPTGHHTYPFSRGSRGARITLGSSRTFLSRLSLWQRQAC